MGNWLDTVRGWVGSAAPSDRIRRLEEEIERLRRENEALRRETSAPPFGQHDELLEAELNRAMRAGRPVSPIRLIQVLRETTPLGLKQAKEVVEDFCARNAPQLLPAWGYLEREIAVLHRREDDPVPHASSADPSAGKSLSRLRSR